RLRGGLGRARERADRDERALRARRAHLDRPPALDRLVEAAVVLEQALELLQEAPALVDVGDDAGERVRAADVGVRERVLAEIAERVGEDDEPVVDRSGGLDDR